VTDENERMLPGEVEPISLEIVRGDPDAEELAAVIAVVTHAYAQEAAASTASEPRARSRWDISARGLRSALPRERGWSGFGG
jgi:hypothetical protein